MKITIELDGARDQAEIKRVTTPVAEQQGVVNSAVSMSSSPIDAGGARVPDAFGNDTTVTDSSQSPRVSNSFSNAGAVDAGAARAQEALAPATAMPDTGNMETFNTANAFSAGAVADPVSN